MNMKMRTNLLKMYAFMAATLIVINTIFVFVAGNSVPVLFERLSIWVILFITYAFFLFIIFHIFLFIKKHKQGIDINTLNSDINIKVNEAIKNSEAYNKNIKIKYVK